MACRGIFPNRLRRARVLTISPAHGICHCFARQPGFYGRGSLTALSSVNGGDALFLRRGHKTHRLFSSPDRPCATRFNVSLDVDCPMALSAIRLANLLIFFRKNFSNLQAAPDVLSNVSGCFGEKPKGDNYEEAFQPYVVGSVYARTWRRRVCQHALYQSPRTSRAAAHSPGHTQR